MTPALLLWIAGAAVGGALLALVAAAALRRSGSDRRLVEAQQRVSVAESTARAEEKRRREVEAELLATEERLRALDRELAVARERVESTRSLLDEQQQFVSQSKKELQDAFTALASAALRGSSEQFLALAEQKLAAAHSRASADLDERKQAIETLLAPLKETLSKLDQRTGEVERARVDAYSRIDEQIRRLAESTAMLQERTTSLATALRGSQVRGRWGEIALRNIAELAGMSEHCDFEEQLTLGGGGRPDMVVHLPGNRMIAVDAKAPLTPYLEATEAEQEEIRQAKLDSHVRALRQHVRDLASRDYAASLGGEIDLVVLFLPGDPFLSAAFQRDPDLQVEALRSKVLIATPTTLVGLLRTVAIYWQQRSMAENARQIADTARELYQRAAKFGEELNSIGRGLKQALDAYNRAVGSFERRFLPMSGRLEQLKVAEQASRDLKAPDPVEASPRLVEE